MNILACLAGMVVVIVLAVLLVGLIYGGLWALETLASKFGARDAVYTVIGSFAVLILLLMFYVIGCDIAQSFGWCEQCKVG